MATFFLLKGSGIVCTGPGPDVHWARVWCALYLGVVYTRPKCGVHWARVIFTGDLGVVCTGLGCDVHWSTLTTSVHP